MTAEDLPGVRRVIESVDLFPADMLDAMADSYLTGTGPDFWMTQDRSDRPVSVAFCAPEQMTEGTWNLYLIAVEAGQQGAGVGSELLHAVETRLRDDGQRLLLVETSGTPEFDAVRAFYGGRGYEQEAAIRDFYQAGEDKIVFRKALT